MVNEMYNGMMCNNALGYCGEDGHPQKGWVFAMHPDGHWVTLFKVPEISQESKESSKTPTNTSSPKLPLLEEVLRGVVASAQVGSIEDFAYGAKAAYEFIVGKIGR